MSFGSSINEQLNIIEYKELYREIKAEKNSHVDGNNRNGTTPNNAIACMKTLGFQHQRCLADWMSSYQSHLSILN